MIIGNRQVLGFALASFALLLPSGAQAASPPTPECAGVAATVVLTPGDDFYAASPGVDDVIVGLEGDDTVLGLDGADIICGGEGADLLFGDGDTNPGSESDLLLGEGDNDTLIGDPGPDLLDGGAGGDDLFGDDLFEDGGASGAGDHLTGGPGDDFVDGGPGGDLIVADQGDDLIDAGENLATGPDVLDYDAAPGAVQVDLEVGLGTGSLGTDLLAGVEVVTGSPFNDVLRGGPGPEVLLGAGGSDDVAGGGGGDELFGDGRAAPDPDSDIVQGDGGDDRLYGDPGDDVMDGGDGAMDIASYQFAPGGVIVDMATGTVGGSLGADRVAGFELVIGSAHADRLFGSEGADNLVGFDGPDFIDGAAGDDSIIGDLPETQASGADLLTGGPGTDVIIGGPRTDTVTYAAEPAGVEADLGTGLVKTGEGLDELLEIENLLGTNFDDVLVGDAGANLLDGAGGADRLRGGPGDDDLQGGEGDTDFVEYVDAQSAVVVDLAAGVAFGGGGNDRLSGTESIIGSDFDDSLTGDGLPNALDGRGGSDVLDGGPGPADTAQFLGADGVRASLAGGTAVAGGETDTLSRLEGLTGSDGDDVLVGDSGPNVLIALTGNDALWGRGGADTLFGGLGDDAVNGGAGDTDTADYRSAFGATSGVSIDLAAGIATSDSFIDRLRGVEILNGSDHHDVLRGNAADNIFIAGPGDDDLDGASGFDQVLYLDALSVNADLSAHSGSAVYPTGSAIDTLTRIEGLMGSVGPDELRGDTEINLLVGSAGDDLVDGAGGNDYLVGDAGDDQLQGGHGKYDAVSYVSEATGVDADLSRGTISVGVEQTDTVTGAEMVAGSESADLLRGGPARDFFLPGGGDDQVFALAGNDAIAASEGDDLLNGGAGRKDTCLEERRVGCELRRPPLVFRRAIDLLEFLLDLDGRRKKGHQNHAAVQGSKK